ncbi:MAG: transporter substrate-binding domain-containing protein, partial [Prevotella sp.]|nr:transporter substrate-binding domain-containing protein [Prevotella sp.]
MTLKKAALGALAVLALIACQPKPADSQSGLTMREGYLTVGMEIGYPPMEYFAEDGKTPIGFDVELAKAIADKMGLTFDYVDTA